MRRRIAGSRGRRGGGLSNDALGNGHDVAAELERLRMENAALRNRDDEDDEEKSTKKGKKDKKVEPISSKKFAKAVEATLEDERYQAYVAELADGAGDAELAAYMRGEKFDDTIANKFRKVGAINLKLRHVGYATLAVGGGLAIYQVSAVKGWHSGKPISWLPGGKTSRR